MIGSLPLDMNSILDMGLYPRAVRKIQHFIYHSLSTKNYSMEPMR
jgi:hypothetical protein